ncbi:glutamate ABC transporter substrate-binding protein [Georgenia thermotolerans]|uniref:Transporter substrate-binding domain-containing protein n=1 Tax=Georgenia thermotolerans TaxID=527326 RepID=A0A7J5UN50_9MICO|nr:glutamate ABC transporter substrate-binding protein [Georgenia thermotolerans]KAE8763822.1 transporter substrate-binding domain-containing protein [Georgenia thermotolerans]
MRSVRRAGLALTAATALILAACSAGEPGQSGGSASAGGSETGSGGAGGDGITIGIKYDQPGLGLKEGNDFTGFDVDVAKYVAGKLGYSEDKIKFVESVSSQRETLLENGSVDMIFATYSITDARKERVSFAGPYFVAGQDLLVAADNTDITGPDSLNGKVLCSVEGSTSAERIRDEHSQQTELYPAQTYSECVELLSAGTVDAVTTDDVILAGYAAQSQYEGKFKLVGKPFSEENYGVGLPKGSDKCEDVNTAITTMIDDGTWEELIKKNVGESFTPNPSQNPPKVQACA